MSSNVKPLRPHVRYWCSDCEEHYHEHERAKHKSCCPHTFCTGCGRAFSPGDDDCPMCGTPQPIDTAQDPPQAKYCGDCFNTGRVYAIDGTQFNRCLCPIGARLEISESFGQQFSASLHRRQADNTCKDCGQVNVNHPRLGIRHSCFEASGWKHFWNGFKRGFCKPWTIVTDYWPRKRSTTR